MKKILITGISLAAMLIGGGAMAEDTGDRQGRRGHRGPPQVAIDACAAAVQGDNCSFTGRQGDTISGTCETPREEQLVCFPEGGPPADRERGERG